MYKLIARPQMSNGLAWLKLTQHVIAMPNRQENFKQVFVSLNKQLGKRITEVDGKEWLQYFQTVRGEDEQKTGQFMNYLLHLAGWSPAPIPIITNRADPSMTFDELIDELVGDYLSSYDVTRTIHGADKVFMTPEQLANDMNSAVIDLQSRLSETTTLVDRLRKLLLHIKFKIKYGREVNEAEKTLFMHTMHATYNTITVEGVKMEMLSAGAEPAESESVLVLGMLAQIAKVTMPGPKTTYVPIESTGTRELPIISQVPHPDKLILCAGHWTRFGMVVKQELKPIDTLLWVDQDNLKEVSLAVSRTSTQLPGPPDAPATYIQRIMSLTGPRCDDGGCVPMRDPAKYTPDVRGSAVPGIPDWADVRLVWRAGEVTMEYFSMSLERTVLTNSYEQIMFDKARFATKIGTSKTGPVNIDDSNDRFLFTSLDTDTSYTVPKTKSFVLYRNARGVLKRVNDVDWRPLLNTLGEHVSRPALSEYFRLPAKVLYQDRPEAISHVASLPEFSLSPGELFVNREAINVCYNFWWYTEVWGIQPTVPTRSDQTLEQAVADIAARLVGFPNATGV